jgi:serine/threonine protein phosphatase 1
MKNNEKRVFCLGDIHGGYKALLQCLERSNFNKEEDTLIQLGDICDGWSEVYECVEELLTIKNLIAIKGNHDDWFNEFLTKQFHPCHWMQGGEGTLKSYCNALDKTWYGTDTRGYITSLLDTDIPESHRNFFKNQLKYYKDKNDNLFVHGGFNRHELLKDQTYDYIFWWDRDLWMQALSVKNLEEQNSELLELNQFKPKFKIKEPVKEIFIGHTTTMNWKTDKPMNAANIWNLDTGCGFKGKLTIMNVDTKEYYQSDDLQELYINEKGRN